MTWAAETALRFRRNVLLVGAGFWAAEGLALATGVNPVPGDLTGVALGAAAAVLAYPPVREGVLRRIAHRPRMIMTDEDYKRLREMEIELGFELGEMPEPTALPLADEPAAETAADRDRLPVGLRPVPGCTCPPVEIRAIDSAVPVGVVCAACEKQISQVTVAVEPSAAPAEHFAALARVGRDSCLSFCPICADRFLELHGEQMRRLILGSYTDLGTGEDRAATQHWLDKERWGER